MEPPCFKGLSHCEVIHLCPLSPVLFPYTKLHLHYFAEQSKKHPSPGTQVLSLATLVPYLSHLQGLPFPWGFQVMLKGSWGHSWQYWYLVWRLPSFMGPPVGRLEIQLCWKGRDPPPEEWMQGLYPHPMLSPCPCLTPHVSRLFPASWIFPLPPSVVCLHAIPQSWSFISSWSFAQFCSLSISCG